MTDKKPNDGLRKLQQAEDAKKAMAEYHAQKAAVDANTQRLRALRLAKEAAEAAAAPAKPVKKSMPSPSTCCDSHRTKALSEMMKLPWFLSGGGTIGNRIFDRSVRK